MMRTAWGVALAAPNQAEAPGKAVVLGGTTRIALACPIRRAGYAGLTTWWPRWSRFRSCWKNTRKARQGRRGLGGDGHEPP